MAPFDRFVTALSYAAIGVLVGLGLSPESRAAPPDTSDVPLVVQPGAPGEPTRVLQEGRSTDAVRVVQPGSPGAPTRVLTRGRIDDPQPPRIVRPGAPGRPSEVQEPGGSLATDPVTHTEADVDFMRGMIVHHAQALQMTALVPERTDTDALRRLAERIERSQDSEIAAMVRWLERRGEAVPARLERMRAAIDTLTAKERLPHDHGPSNMAGMLSPDEMETLAASSGEAFDRHFLEFMIVHHEGALTMVEALMDSPEGGQEAQVFTFASEVEADQRMEIRRMESLLSRLP